MLPEIKQPYYTTTLPISKDNVRYRPYLVKEEKIILIAMSGGEGNEMKDAIQQIISNCTDGEVNPSNLNSIDISFLMSKIRSASKGGIVEIGMRCKNEVSYIGDDKELRGTTKICNHLNTVPVDLENMGITDVPDGNLDIVKIDEKYSMKLKMPGLDILDTLAGQNINIVDMLPNVIDYVFDDDGIYKLRDETPEGIDKFIESLNDEHLKAIDKYFATIPKLKVEVSFTCEKCGHQEELIVEDVQNFF